MMTPINLVMGVNKSSLVINMIDFGLVKTFRDPWTTMHIYISKASSTELEHPVHVNMYPQQHQ